MNVATLAAVLRERARLCAPDAWASAQRDEHQGPTAV